MINKEEVKRTLDRVFEELHPEAADPMDKIIQEDLLAEAERVRIEIEAAGAPGPPPGVKEEIRKKLHKQIDEYEKKERGENMFEAVIKEIDRDFDENGNYAASYAEWMEVKMMYVIGSINPLAIEEWQTEEFANRVVEYIKNRIIRQYMQGYGYKDGDPWSEDPTPMWYLEEEFEARQQ